MKFRTLLAATAALSLAASPALASANGDRVSAPVAQEESDLEGGSGILVALLGAAAVIAAIILASDSSDDDVPVSA